MNSDAIVSLVSIIACGCILPIVMGWLGTRRKMNETETRKQIILAAIEKNKETDVEELLKKMAPKQKLLKEKLLVKLLLGWVVALVGFGLIGFRVWYSYTNKPNVGFLEFLSFLALIGSVLLAIGLAFVIYYFVGKKLLAKEIEAEEKKLTAEANQ